MRSGVRVACITVPAVTEVCSLQPVQIHKFRRVAWPALCPPQPGQTNPSGHRQSNRYSRQASSVAKRVWKSMIERGNPGRGTPSSSQIARMEPTGYALVA